MPSCGGSSQPREQTHISFKSPMSLDHSHHLGSLKPSLDDRELVSKRKEKLNVFSLEKGEDSGYKIMLVRGLALPFETLEWGDSTSSEATEPVGAAGRRSYTCRSDPSWWIKNHLPAFPSFSWNPGV